MQMFIISLDRGLGAYDKAVVRDENGEIIGMRSQTLKLQLISLSKYRRLKCTHTKRPKLRAKIRTVTSKNYVNPLALWPFSSSIDS